MVITTRMFNPETDSGFIIDSMPKDIYFDSHPRRGRPSPKWFEAFHKYLTSVLKTANVIIATSDEDSDFIIGYAIFTTDQLEFVYVKEAYRKQGIGTMLANHQEYSKINEDNMTKLGRKILEQNSQEDVLTKQEPQITHSDQQSEASDTDRLSALIAPGIPISKATFQSAILSGFNAAEFQLDLKSHNKARVPTSMHYTAYGLVIVQNGMTFITPTSNVIQVYP